MHCKQAPDSNINLRKGIVDNYIDVVVQLYKRRVK